MYNNSSRIRLDWTIHTKGMKGWGMGLWYRQQVKGEKGISVMQSDGNSLKTDKFERL